jgi:carbonic anhydrase
MFKSFNVISLLAGTALADELWNYKQNGADWPAIPIKTIKDNNCGGKMQSPIDLPKTVPDKDIIPYKEDQFNKIYDNPENVEIEWDGHTVVSAWDVKKSTGTF